MLITETLLCNESIALQWIDIHEVNTLHILIPED